MSTNTAVDYNGGYNLLFKYMSNRTSYSLFCSMLRQSKMKMNVSIEINVNDFLIEENHTLELSNRKTISLNTINNALKFLQQLGFIILIEKSNCIYYLFICDIYKAIENIF